MAELLTFVLNARDRIMMLMILTIAVIFVTYLIYTISGRSSLIKYLPGTLLVIAGFYYLYRGMQQLTTQSGLNELMSAIIFIVIGLIGICFSLILGIYHQGEGRKTKGRVQALDYLQEARTAEPVVYPTRTAETFQNAPQMDWEAPVKKAEPVKEEIPQPPIERDQAAIEREKEQERRKEQKILEEAKRQTELTERADRKQALLAANEKSHTALLDAVENDFLKQKEEGAIARLEKQLEKKNAHRQALIEYNEKAAAVNQKETVSAGDQFSLLVARNRIQFARWTSDASYRLQEGYANTALLIKRALKKFRLAIGYRYANAMTGSQARKISGDSKEPKDS